LRDPGSGDEIDSIELERVEEGRAKPGLLAETIPDQTGDGSPELGVVTNVGGRSNLDIRYYVVDPTAGKVLQGGEGRQAGFVGLDDGVGVVGLDGSVTRIDPNQGVTLADTGSGSELDLSWSFDSDANYVSRIYVDGRPVTLTTGTEATIRLPKGDHTIQVRATSEDGQTVYDSTEVSVSEESSMDLVLLGGTLVAVGVLFVPFGLWRFKS
jgi:hypothetical protein